VSGGAPAASDHKPYNVEQHCDFFWRVHGVLRHLKFPLVQNDRNETKKYEIRVSGFRFILFFLFLSLRTHPNTI